VPVIRLLLAARRFFHDPASGARFLAGEGITHVVVLTRAGFGYPQPIGRVDVGGLDGVPFLRPVYRSSAVSVYQVVGLRHPGRPFVRPSIAQGSACVRGALRT
jgi:hypothetical protein